MIIKNFYIGNNANIIDQFIKNLIKNNISYVLIKNQNYVEIHFLDNIYRLYFNCYNIIMFENNNLFSELSNELSYNSNNESFYNLDDMSYNQQNERPGYKKYTKKMYKYDKYKYGKTNKKGY